MVRRLCIADLVPLLGVRVSGVFVFGTDASTKGSVLWGTGGRPLAMASGVVVVGVVGLLVWRAARRDQVVALTLVAYAVIAFVVPSWGRGTSMVIYFGGPSIPAGTTRFSVVPVFLLSFAIAILVDPVGSSRDRLVARVGRPLFVVHAVVLASVGFAIVNPSFLGLSWRDTVEAARVECAGRAPDDLVKLPTMTVDTFSVTLSCADVRR